VQNLNLQKKNLGMWAKLILVTIAALLASCGDGGVAPGTTTTNTTTGSTTSTAMASLSISLTDSTGTITTSVSSGGPTTARVTILDAAGAPVPNLVVTFSTNATLVTLTPSSGTALTNASGIATVTMNPAGTTTGATTVTASSQVGTTSVTGSIGFSVGGLSTSTTPLVISTPVFGVGTAALSAFGTTSVSVTVTSGGVAITTPLPVTFASPCAAAGTATLTASVTTVAGVAVASYHDNGCGGTDLVTATVSSNISASSTLTITPPATGSIQFVSATPSNISLKGTGGTEVSQVLFKVLDAGGNPLGGKVVTFSLDTTVGGITLNPTPPTAISGSDGLAVALVSAGTISTPVRVTATTPGVGSVVLSTQSNQLSISTGIPDQDSFSLSASRHNIEGLTIDGTTSIITARLSDHFNNPVPNGTPVSFTAEGGSIVASCSTVNGACTTTFTSQSPRPSNGRVTVVAYAVGEESFTDNNGNGLADTGELGADLAEVYRDDNESNSRDAGEPFIDFDTNLTFSAPDGKFNGVLCSTPGTGICSAVKTVHVRASQVIVLSGSTASNISVTPNPIDLDLNGSTGGSGCGLTQTLTIDVRDVNGNPMPVGTTIVVSTTNGTLDGSSTSYVVPDTTSPTPFPVFIKGDGTLASGVCTDTATRTGQLNVTVTVPSGLRTTQYFSVTN
jgi:hypothetical protein